MFRSIAANLAWVANWRQWATRDFCPGANKYVYWLKTPIGWFALAAFASAIVGMSLSPTGWYLCVLFILVMALGVVWPWVAITGISAKLEFTSIRIPERESAEGSLVVTNWRPWPVWGLLVEGTSFDEEASETEPIAALCRIGAYSSASFSFAFTPRRRGIYPLQTPELSTGFPFGLWNASKPVLVEQTLIVWPASSPIDLPHAAPIQQALQCDLANASGDEGDVIGARPYRRGDSLQSVNWGQTARRSSLIVRERQSFTSEECTIRLDPAVFHGDTQRDAVDWGVRAIASLCDLMQSRSALVYLELNGKLQPVPFSRDGYAFVLDQLAVFCPNSDTSLKLATNRRNTILITTADAQSAATHSAGCTVVLSKPGYEAFDGERTEKAGDQNPLAMPCLAGRRPNRTTRFYTPELVASNHGASV